MAITGMTTSRGLNLSASEKESPARASCFAARITGAQRLSASEKESQDTGGFSVKNWTEVLNACRRRRRNHGGVAIIESIDQMCSTPVGVGEGITTSSGNLHHRAEGAHRLSA